MENRRNNLKPQDCLVLASRIFHPSYDQQNTAAQVMISQSSASYSYQRLRNASLLLKSGEANLANSIEFMIYAIKYLYPAKLSNLSVGIPTAHSHPSLNFVNWKGQFPIIWPFVIVDDSIDSEIKLVRGETLQPIHKNVPFVSFVHYEFHQLFALIDMIRIGKAREKKIAQDELKKFILEWVKHGCSG